ncbi:MAG: hypothetical protein WC269_03930 [Candidatus Gracilibacteria bacterium]|jgi:acetylglutamate kinase
MKGLGGSDETKTNEVDSRGLTQKDRDCLVAGLNVASAIASELTGEKIFLAVPALGVEATDNSPELVELNEQRRQEWEKEMERKRQEQNRGGLSAGAALAGLFAAVVVAQAGATGKQVLNVLESTGLVKKNGQ